MPAYVYFRYCGVCSISVQLVILGFTPPNKWNQPQFKCGYEKLLSGTAMLAKHQDIASSAMLYA